jgi:copper transport protein
MRWRRLLVAAVFVFLAPSILFAHARLVRSVPSSDARLTASPSRIRLEFSEIPMLAVSRISLVGPHGVAVTLSELRTDFGDAHALIAELVSPIDSGAYEVTWSTAASDGHASHGSFRFVVTSSALRPSAASTTAAGTELPGMQSPSTTRTASAGERRRTEAQNASDAVALSYPMIMARWLGFLALFCLIGAVSFRYLILGRISRLGPPADPFALIASTGAATFGLFAAVALAVATVAKLYGETLAMNTVSVRTILFDTGWGWAWIAQMAAALIAIVAFRIAHSERSGGWSLAAPCALVVAITPALTGHAISSDEALFAVPLDILHVIAGSVWLGTLAVIVIVGIGAALKTPGTVGVGVRVASMINAFSPIALVCGATIVASGIIASLFHLEPLSTLWTSGYGKVLILKLALVGLLFTVGAWNWRRVKPTLGGDPGVAALARSARMELVAGAMVLAVTALLVAMALPG